MFTNIVNLNLGEQIREQKDIREERIKMQFK